MSKYRPGQVVDYYDKEGRTSAENDLPVTAIFLQDGEDDKALIAVASPDDFFEVNLYEIEADRKTPEFVQVVRASSDEYNGADSSPAVFEGTEDEVLRQLNQQLDNWDLGKADSIAEAIEVFNGSHNGYIVMGRVPAFSGDSRA